MHYKNNYTYKILSLVLAMLTIDLTNHVMSYSYKMPNLKQGG